MTQFCNIPVVLIPEDATVRHGWKVSKDGIVITPSGVETKGTLTSDSSYIVMVPRQTGIAAHVRVAELVSKTFQPHLHDVDTDLYHLDGDNQNNHLDNLKPMNTNEYLRYKAKKEAAKICIQVDQFDLSGNLIQTFDNCRAAKLSIGDAKSDPGLGKCMRDGDGCYKGFVYKLRNE